MKCPRAITWFNRFIGISILLLVVIIASLFTWVHTPHGARQIEHWISTASQGTVDVSGLSIHLPRRLAVQHVTIRDHDQFAWLHIEDIFVRISWRAFLQRELAFRELSLGAVSLSATPNYQTTGDPIPDDRPPQSRPLLQSLRVDALRIDHFAIDPAIAGRPVHGTLAASARHVIGGRTAAETDWTVAIPEAGPIHGEAAIEGENFAWNLSRLSARIGPDTLTGTARYRTDLRAMTAEATLSVADCATYQPLHGQDLSGPATAAIRVSRAGTNMPWTIQTRAASPALHYGPASASNLVAEASLALDAGSLTYTARVTSARIAMPPWSLAPVSATSYGSRHDHTLTATVSGQRDDATFTGSAQATVNLNNPTPDVNATLDQFEAAWRDLALHLLEPATVHYQGDEINVHLPSLRLNDMPANLAARVTGGMLDELRGGIEHVDLALLNRYGGPELPAIEGQASLAIHLHHLRQAPTGTIHSAASGITIDYGPLRHFNNAGLSLAATLNATGIIATVTVEHPLVEQFKTGITLPLVHVDRFLPLALDHDRGIGTRIILQGNIGEIGDAMLDIPTALAGQLDINMAIDNLPALPQFDGYFRLHNGQYRNLATGTFLENINVVLRGEDADLVLEEAGASDGGRGRVTAEGRVHFEDGWFPEWVIAATLRNATLFRVVRTELPLSGTLQASGSRKNAQLHGDLWLEPFRFVIPRRLPPSIPTLDVIEINHPDPSRNTVLETVAMPEPDPEATPAGPVFDLDVRIRTRRGFEVTGRGLQSEWRGDMQLGGTSADPLLTGSAEVVRGYAMLLGRRFAMDEGRIVFTGPVPPDPQLNIELTAPVADYITRLSVIGQAGAPLIRISADPPLPEDEVMAMILFGRSIETMTPWQALALANSLRILGGSGGDTVDILNTTQSILRVDQIDIKQDEEGEGFSSVTVGKYFGQRLYVEGEKGFGEAEDTFTVTIELTPRIVLETEASPRIREGISLFWRKDL